MSVLSCSRNGCAAIMCDRYSPDHGYICDECFEELVIRGSRQNIDEFMSEWVGDRYYTSENARERFESIFTTE